MGKLDRFALNWGDPFWFVCFVFLWISEKIDVNREEPNMTHRLRIRRIVLLSVHRIHVVACECSDLKGMNKRESYFLLVCVIRLAILVVGPRECQRVDFVFVVGLSTRLEQGVQLGAIGIYGN